MKKCCFFNYFILLFVPLKNFISINNKYFEMLKNNNINNINSIN